MPMQGMPHGMQTGMPPPGMFHPGMMSPGMGMPQSMSQGMPHGGMPGMHPGMQHWPGMHGWPGFPGMPPAKAKKDKKDKEGKEKKEKEGKDKKRRRNRSPSSGHSDRSRASSGASRKKKKKKRGKEKDKKKNKKARARSSDSSGSGDGYGDDARAAAAKAAVAGALAAAAASGGGRGRAAAAAAAANGRRIAAGRSQSQDSSGSKAASIKREKSRPRSPSESSSSSSPKPAKKEKKEKKSKRQGFVDPRIAAMAESAAMAAASAAAQTAMAAVANRGGAAAFEAPPRQERSGWDTAGAGFSGRPERVDVLPLPRDIIERIIGRSGDKIKEIRDRSGARVDARDQTEDPVHVLISGSDQAVEIAKAMLREAAEQAARSPAVNDDVSRARAQAEAAAAAVSAAAAKEPQGPPMIEGVVELPKTATGKIIGTKGSQIAELRQRSGAQVDVDKSAAVCRVRLIGSQEQVDHCKALIAQLMLPPGETGPGGVTAGEYLDIPKGSVGRIIGAGGSRIQELQERSGAKIDIDRTNPERIMVRFSGFPENVAAAKSMVAEVLEGRDRSVQGEAQTIVHVPSSCTGRLIGPGGKQINTIQEISGAKVDVDKSTEPCIVRIVGTKEAVSIAEAMVHDVVATMPPAALYARPPGAVPPPPPPMVSPSPGRMLNLLGMTGGAPAAMDEETIRFDCQLSVLEKLLASEGGNFARNLTSQTGARLQVKRDPSGACFLELIGQPEQVVEAESVCDDAARLLSAAAIADAADAMSAAPPFFSPPPLAQLALPPPAPGAATLQRPPGPCSAFSPLMGAMAKGGGAPPPAASAMDGQRFAGAPWNSGPGRPAQPPPESAASVAVSVGIRPSMSMAPMFAPAPAPMTAPGTLMGFSMPASMSFPGQAPPPPWALRQLPLPPPGSVMQPLAPAQWAMPMQLMPPGSGMQPMPPWAMHPAQS